MTRYYVTFERPEQMGVEVEAKYPADAVEEASKRIREFRNQGMQGWSLVHIEDLDKKGDKLDPYKKRFIATGLTSRGKKYGEIRSDRIKKYVIENK